MIAGSWSWCAITSGALVTLARATLDSGTVPLPAPPPLVRTASLSSRSLLVRNSGATSSTTRYWFNSVKMVEIRRWPNALYKVSSMLWIATPRRLALAAVDREQQLQSFRREVVVHVGQLGPLAQQRSHACGSTEFLRIDVGQRVLVFGRAGRGCRVRRPARF